jgi:RNA polymerase sigma-70 factor (ECF subfamily)
VVLLNQAVAVGMAHGPEAGLEMLDRLVMSIGERMDGYYLLPAARADLLRRLNRPAEAAAEYRRALALVTTDPERRFLERRLAETTSASNSA